MGYRIGTDIGGTFTDLSLARDGILVGRFSHLPLRKTSEGVLNCVCLAGLCSKKYRRTQAKLKSLFTGRRLPLMR